MQSRLRPYATAGVALVGAGAIAISPIAPPTSAITVASPEVQLSAAVDPIDRWLEVFDGSQIAGADLSAEWQQAPLPVLQQVMANQIRNIRALPDFELIIGNVLNNLENGVSAPFAPDVGELGEAAENPLLLALLLLGGNPDNAIDTGALDPLHGLIYYAMTQGIPGLAEGDPPLFEPIIPAELAPVVGLLTTSLSGVLLGLVGPVVAPVLALGAGFQAVFDELSAEDPDLESAFNSLVNIPADMADAFLNGGQTLDLTPVVSLLAADLLPEGTEIGIALGGLLSPGGNIFNALDLTVPFDLLPEPLHIAGQGPGAIGSLIDLTKTIAKAIGWDGTGNPLAPPLAPLEPPAEEPAEEDEGPAANSLLSEGAPTVSMSTDVLTKNTAAKQTAVVPEKAAVKTEVVEETPALEAVDAADALKETEQEKPTSGSLATQLSEANDDAAADEAATESGSTNTTKPRNRISGAIANIRDNIQERKDQRAEKRAERKAERAAKRAADKDSGDSAGDSD